MPSHNKDLPKLPWAKIYEKLENCACGILKIKDAVANAAIRVAKAPKKGIFAETPSYLGNIGWQVLIMKRELVCLIMTMPLFFGVGGCMAFQSHTTGTFKNPTERWIFENDLRSIALRIWLSEWSTDPEPIDVAANISDEMFCDDGTSLSVRRTDLWDHWCLPIKLSRLSDDEYELRVSDLIQLPKFMGKFIDALQNYNILEAYLMSHDRASYIKESIPFSPERYRDTALSRLNRLYPLLQTYPNFEKLISDCMDSECERLTAIRNAIPSNYDDIQQYDGFYSITIRRNSR